MTLLSGFCLDEILARDLDKPASAERFHAKCTSENCTCAGHREAA